MIDFKSTSEQNGLIEYYNQKGEVVKTYQLSELENYVVENKLNISYEHEAEGGTGMVCDPNTDFKEIEIIQPISEYIDDNWLEVTEKFYNSVNKSGFRSCNTEQQTRKAVLS